MNASDRRRSRQGTRPRANLRLDQRGGAPPLRARRSGRLVDEGWRL